jgi:glycosyltransferase involved in cell wall biosynthesis
MSLGVPVIATRIRGTRDLLDRDAGLLVDVGDVDGLARAMSMVIDQPQAVAAMAQAARQRIPIYRRDRILQLHETLYEEALGS